MSDAIQAETGFISLAELAQMNTDDVSVILSRVPHAGLFRVRCLTVAGKEGDAVEGKPPLLRFNYSYEIIGGQCSDKKIDMEKLLGKKLTESYTLWPADVLEGIGLLKGRYQKVGLPNSGMPIGGVEGMEPGWLDTAVGHEFDIKVSTYAKNGIERASFDWMTPPKEIVSSAA